MYQRSFSAGVALYLAASLVVLPGPLPITAPPSPSPAATSQPVAERLIPQLDRQVWIGAATFTPEVTILAAGASVTWSNEDTEPHSVRSTDGLFASGELDPGDTFQHRFDTAGTFAYYCEFDPGMIGTVIVAEKASHRFLPYLVR